MQCCRALAADRCDEGSIGQVKRANEASSLCVMTGITTAGYSEPWLLWMVAAHRTQATALAIKARAKHRLAEDYDAAQARGEAVGVRGGKRKSIGDANASGPATAAEFGLTRYELLEARLVRDAEALRPGSSIFPIGAGERRRPRPREGSTPS